MLKHRKWIISSVILVFTACFWFFWNTSSPAREIRRAVLQQRNPLKTSEELEASMLASDQIHLASGAEDGPQDVRQAMAQIQVTDMDLRGFYERNRSVFGQRSFEQSRIVVDRLYRIQRVRALWGLPPGTALNP